MTRVLIVDDQEELTLVWAEFLRRAGHSVVVSRSVSEALASLEPAPGFALVDWTLDDGTAAPLLEALRTRFPACRLVLTTGHGEDVAGRFGRDVDVLRKPFSLRELTRRLGTSAQ